MSFLSGSILWNLLWIIPLILVLAIAGGVRRNKLLRKMFGTDERAARFSNASPGKRVFRIILLTLAVLLLAVAAARPSWGKQVMHNTSTGRDLLVVFDVSKSMLSDDVKPSRMDHAKWLVREIVKKNPGDRFGLIAFAGESFLVCPLTVDRASFIQLVDDLDTDTIPVGGTNVQLALEEAVRAFEGAQGMHKAVVLVTDGDELTGRGASVVNDLSKAQIPIFAVGVGDPSNPAVIRVPDEDGKLRILTDREGNPVKSPLNEPQLTELARRTGGIYVRSTAAYSGIDELETRIRRLDRKESENAVSTFRPIERPAYPLTAAIILLALFFCVSETRPRSVQMILALAALLFVAAPNESRAQAASAPAQIQQTQAAAPATAESEAEQAAPEPVRSASELYNSGLEQQQVEQDNEKARSFYERAIAASEKEPLVRASSYQNIGVISHLDARSSMQGALDKLQAQDLNSAEKAVGEALTKLNRTEELYRESMRSAAADASVIRNQQILLADRKQAEEMKKQIEELKKLMEQARQQTQDAHDQQQQENQQQNQDQQQSGEQNQQDQQQNQDQQNQQDQQSEGQNQQDQPDQQQSGDQNQQQNQQQSGDQNQQQQDQQSAQDKTKQAEDTVSELEQKASEMNQDRQKQAARQAREELQKAREEQEQGNGEKAEEHLKNALDTLNQNQQDQEDQQGDQEKQDEQSGDQGEQQEQDQPQQGDRDEQQPRQGNAQEAQQDMGDMEKQQAEAILDMMSKDELDYKDANRMQRPARLNNRVEKDW
jgi:Ca-activated chloride channel family protein